jgi:hypothetical protein
LRSPKHVRLTVQNAGSAPIKKAVAVVTGVENASDDQGGRAGAATVEVRPGEPAQAVIAVSSQQGPR